MSKTILCCVSFACNKMQNQIFELPEVRKSALFLKGFQTGKRRWRDSRSIKCHRIASYYETNVSRACGNVWEMFSDAAKKTMESNLICFIKVIECLQYLARQEQAMQGDTDDESNFIQLLKLRGKDQPLFFLNG